MSKILYACWRDGQLRPGAARRLQRLASRLSPDNIAARPPQIIEQAGLLAAIFDPSAAILVREAGVCLGGLFERGTQWWLPGSASPDGSYALFRGDAGRVEALTDAVASRSIWYYCDEQLFAASTSQRALIGFLGSFTFNPTTLPWALSTGTPGPGLAWDPRLKCLPGEAVLQLDRRAWRVSVQAQPPAFTPQPGTDAEHRARLQQAVQETLAGLDLDYTHWVLPLSGGFDSRGLLCLTPNVRGLNTVTWGLAASRNDPENDAYLARAVAEARQVRNDFFDTTPTAVSLDSTLARYLAGGEGRVDHLAGYMDGFAVWKTLFENGVHGIIRGDEGFGWVPVGSAAEVRATVGLDLCADFANLGDPQRYGLPAQTLPPELEQRPGESAAAWRDRLYHQFRIPTVLAALNDLKVGYVEIVAPLLARRILHQVRQLPDHLRTDKRLFRELVRAASPDIPFARRQAVDSVSDIMRSAAAVELLRAELQAGAAFPAELRQRVLERLETGVEKEDRRRDGWRSRVKKLAPAWLKTLGRQSIARRKVDYNIVAFRMYIVQKTQTLFSVDAQTAADLPPV